jgi:hypothetical protein
VTSPHEVSGLAAMLEDLVTQNLERDPGRRRLLTRPLRVVIEVPDAAVRASIGVDDGQFRVRQGDDPSARVRVRANGLDVLGLATVPLSLGLPDVRTVEGRRVVSMLLTGRIRVRGLVRYLGEVRRLTQLLSAR